MASPNFFMDFHNSLLPPTLLGAYTFVITHEKQSMYLPSNIRNFNKSNFVESQMLIKPLAPSIASITTKHGLNKPLGYTSSFCLLQQKNINFMCSSPLPSLTSLLLPN
ncbi:hypothetical protein Dimus_022243 [Dionaea muscipula]